jgi:hypothetical protein
MKLIMENWRGYLQEQNNDFCSNFPAACKGAYGTKRANMPQIPDADTFEKEIEAPPPKGEDAKKMTIEKVNMPIEELLKVANAYTDAIGGTRHSGGGTTMKK